MEMRLSSGAGTTPLMRRPQTMRLTTMIRLNGHGGVGGEGGGEVGDIYSRDDVRG